MDHKQFLKEFVTDSALGAELKAILAEKRPLNDEEKYAAIVEFAAEKGCTVTVEEISLAMAGCRELDAEELEHIAGGWCTFVNQCSLIINSKKRTQCDSTFDPYEICWYSDKCWNDVYLYPNIS